MPREFPPCPPHGRRIDAPIHPPPDRHLRNPRDRTADRLCIVAFERGSARGEQLSPQNYRQMKKQREAAQKARQLKKLQRRQKPETETDTGTGTETGTETGQETSALEEKTTVEGVSQPAPGSTVDAD